MNGTPMPELKDMGGWKDMKMLIRYAHLSTQHLQKFAAEVLLDYPKKS